MVVTNPEMRKLYKRLYHIAKASVKGDKVMCACGCLTYFKKRTDSQVFANKIECKDRYYNLTRSKSNYALTSEALGVRRSIWSYISKKGFKL